MDGWLVRGRAAAVPVLAALVVAGAALAGLALAPRPGAAPQVSVREEAAPAPAADAPTARDAVPERVRALEALLARRSAALVARDGRGWVRDVAPGTGYAARQAEVFERLADLPLSSWRWDYLGPGAALAPERSAGPAADDPQPADAREPGRTPWVAHVTLVYRLAAGGQVRRDQYLTLAHDGGRWQVVDDADGPTARDLWDLGPVDVARGRRSLVLGTDVGGYPALVDAAALAVDAAWGPGWPRTSVVEVPASQEQMAALLGRADPGALDAVAAVTTGETLGGAVTTAGDRVVVNPAGLARLAPEGREVVLTHELTHELTHVATRHGAAATVPTWLSEGYADWVGYRGHDLTATDVAAPLLDAVRAGDAPDHLPGDTGFDPARGDVAVAYAGSWLAVDLLARREGEQAVTALYRDVAGTGSSRSGARDQDAAARLDRALRARLGTGTPALTLLWRQEAVRLAGGAP